jgi:hypothetical protein
MADVTRVHGDADGVVNMDIGLAGDTSSNIIIATGLTKHPTAYKITANVVLDQGVGSATETILRKLQTAATVVMYQVDGVQLSVLVEAQGFGTDLAAQAAIDSGNVSTAANANVRPIAITSTSNFKLA